MSGLKVKFMLVLLNCLMLTDMLPAEEGQWIPLSIPGGPGGTLSVALTPAQVVTLHASPLHQHNHTPPPHQYNQTPPPHQQPLVAYCALYQYHIALK